MIEKESILLTLFEEKIRELIRLCDDRKRQIDGLKLTLTEKEALIRQNKQDLSSLQAKYTNLLTTHILAKDETGFKDAQKRVEKLVREVNECITLLK
jgi:peptidoglycan hydrolase CwlO-like protein